MSHQEPDGLSDLLREWKAPEPWPGTDARMLAAFRSRLTRQQQRHDWWRRVWTARVTVPVPVLAGLLLVLCVAAVWFRQPRPVPFERTGPPPLVDGYITRVEAAGFQPLRDAPVHIIRRKERN